MKLRVTIYNLNQFFMKLESNYQVIKIEFHYEFHISLNSKSGCLITLHDLQQAHVGNVLDCKLQDPHP